MVRIIESKQDIQNLINFAGEDLAQKFFNVREKLHSPYNDIYYWLKKPKEDLENYLNNYTSNTEKKKSIKRSNAVEVYSDDDWLVIAPLDWESAFLYSRNTKWCINKNTYKYNKDDVNHFERITNDGTTDIYIYINKKENKKYGMEYNCRTKRYLLFDELNNPINFIPNAPQIEDLPDVSIEEI